MEIRSSHCCRVNSSVSKTNNLHLELVNVTDVFTTAKRSEVMSRIRSKGNRQTELRLIAIFREWGITGWRRNRPVYGKPDFVFPAERVAVFVDGCFWHGCPQHYNVPANNAAFWQKKLIGNRKRDRLVRRTLELAGWKVIRLWEHSLRGTGARVAGRVSKALVTARNSDSDDTIQTKRLKRHVPSTDTKFRRNQR